jgi:hypothetical protein
MKAKTKPTSPNPVINTSSKDIIKPNLSTIQLPASLLEIQGFAVGKQIQNYVTSVNLPLDILISLQLTVNLLS